MGIQGTTPIRSILAAAAALGLLASSLEALSGFDFRHAASDAHHHDGPHHHGDSDDRHDEGDPDCHHDVHCCCTHAQVAPAVESLDARLLFTSERAGEAQSLPPAAEFADTLPHVPKV